ncbi:hypothetical protein U1E44_10300 [Arenibacter sp. GZD96]|uniref:hypothetical protein n=1 Tax=Aurantibrevibacter litoralis TaxID=3106030 RepID=UPI002AFFAEFC|nr:hypothetical protein [Arenibacter sp. GZD-96]MEA1786482.1 hypothetical protein [Arenibacter sp. GZD-96]
MIEYIRHIEEYLNYWYSSFSKLVPESEWGNQKLAEEYLQKYWLTENEYQNIWKPIQDKIFIQQKGLPDLIFTSNYKMIPLIGGCLFVKEDFEQLQKVIKNIGETHFVIIQNTQDFTEGEPMFRMKFPIDITWEELISGNYISAVLFEMHYNEYFVFGASAKWGKYSATEYEHPLDILGFNPEYDTVFTEQFLQAQIEQDQIQKLLPPKYKESF